MGVSRKMSGGIPFIKTENTAGPARSCGGIKSSILDDMRNIQDIK